MKFTGFAFMGLMGYAFALPQGPPVPVGPAPEHPTLTGSIPSGFPIPSGPPTPPMSFDKPQFPTGFPDFPGLPIPSGMPSFPEPLGLPTGFAKRRFPEVSGAVPAGLPTPTGFPFASGFPFPTSFAEPPRV